MVTYFNRKDLVSFGNYLLSEKRKTKVQAAFDEKVSKGSKHPVPVEDMMKGVTHSDVENWIVEAQKGGS